MIFTSYRLRRLFIWLLFGLCLPQLATAKTYYVSPSGNDSDSGTSPETPWKTVAKVNESRFAPGDKILFEDTKTFEGPLKLTNKVKGTASAPVTVGSYPLDEYGFAIIDGGQGRGIDVYNASDIYITNLRVYGEGTTKNHDSGIVIHTSSAAGARHIRIENVDVSGFGRDGISVGAWNTKKGYSDVVISNCKAYNNLQTGIAIWGPDDKGLYVHSDIRIDNCEAYNIEDGPGITMFSVNKGTIERCVTHDNADKRPGGSGILIWNSSNVLYQLNECRTGAGKKASEPVYADVDEGQHGSSTAPRTDPAPQPPGVDSLLLANTPPGLPTDALAPPSQFFWQGDNLLKTLGLNLGDREVLGVSPPWGSGSNVGATRK